MKDINNITFTIDKNFFNPTLEECFQFWDKFLESWFSNTFFKEETILCSLDFSKEVYMPEPYWGWNGKGDLYSVIINYHPGPGGPPQTREILADIFNNCLSYQINLERSLKEKLTKEQKGITKISTEKWHLERRAKMLASLIEYSVKDTSHHLSLEFCPLHLDSHTKVYTFVKNNPLLVLRYILGLAAVASRKITGPLNRKVFLRISEDSLNSYMKKLGFEKIRNVIEISPNKQTYREKESCFALKPVEPGNLKSYVLSPWPDIEFVRVTGVRNYFPKNITKKIIIKLTK